MLTLKGKMLQWVALYWNINGYLFQPPVKEKSSFLKFECNYYIYTEARLYLYTLDYQCLFFSRDSLEGSEGFSMFLAKCWRDSHT